MTLDKPFVTFLLGLLMSLTAVVGVYTHVSSLNVDGGLGTTSLAVAYIASLFLASLTPVISYRFGCKKVLVASEIAYVVFILGNAYSNVYTTLPAGFFLGVGEAWYWTAAPIITTFFAKKKAGSDMKNQEKQTRLYTGFYFAVVQASVVLGNGISAGVLFVDQSLSEKLHPLGNYSNLTNDNTIIYTHCGANDCQDANITNENINQYKPFFAATRYMLIAIFLMLILVAIALHSAFLPNEISWELNESEKQQDSPTFLSVDDQQEVVPVSANEEVHTEETMNTNSKSIRSAYCVLMKSTLKLSILPKHLLVFLLAIYNGMTIGFALAELTRAYSSCILGVDTVGVCVVIYGAMDCVFSVIAGKWAARFGRNIPFLFAFIVDVGNYIFALHWQTNQHNTWLVYMLFLSFGASDGIWQTLVNALYGEYFVEKQNTAYNLWNVVMNVGFLIQYSISPILCVYVKVYLQLGILCLAMVLYGISQVIFYPAVRGKRKLEVETADS